MLKDIIENTKTNKQRSILINWKVGVSINFVNQRGRFSTFISLI